MSTTTKARYHGHPTNSAYQSERALVLREWMFDIMGRRCEECGCTTGPFEVNHMWRREWCLTKVSAYKRALRYWKEVKRGLCNVLCQACNSNWRAFRTDPPPPEGHITTAYSDWLERFRERNPMLRTPP